MYELKKKNGKVFTSESVGTGTSSYEKSIYRATVSQRLRNSDLEYFFNFSVLVRASDILLFLTEL